MEEEEEEADEMDVELMEVVHEEEILNFDKLWFISDRRGWGAKIREQWGFRRGHGARARGGHADFNWKINKRNPMNLPDKNWSFSQFLYFQMLNIKTMFNATASFLQSQCNFPFYGLIFLLFFVLNLFNYFRRFKIQSKFESFCQIFTPSDAAPPGISRLFLFISSLFGINFRFLFSLLPLFGTSPIPHRLDWFG